MLFIHLKSCSFLRYLSFCPDFLGHLWRRLDKKAKFDSKITTSTTGKLIITINLENKPMGLYISRAFLGGLIFGGAYNRGKK